MHGVIGCVDRAGLLARVSRGMTLWPGKQPPHQFVIIGCSGNDHQAETRARAYTKAH
jgi:hypothetical protein